MNKFDLLREILNELKVDKLQRLKAGKILEEIEGETEGLKFLIKRYNHDQKVNENFVRKTVELLEESNGNLKKANEKLFQANQELVRSNDELERFAYIASHDLKTPIQNIISFSKLLKNKLQLDKNSELSKYLYFINEGGRIMKSLIEDVLEYSKLSKIDNYTNKMINLNTIIEEILLSISEYINVKNAKVEVLTPLPSIIGSRAKFYILFKNLIENGVKYNNNPDPLIKIYGNTKNERCFIYVEDNGIGIKEEFQDKIFQLFQRLHSHSEYEGSGLGLATCKKIVEGYDGKISVKSFPGVKTIFKIDFSIKKTNQ